MTLLNTFTDIARQAGFTLPDTLAAWYGAGMTNSDDIRAMAPVYDFEWISPASAQQTMEEWLNPAAQHGNRFFPFAESGAGDAYCLVKLADGREGVAQVWHDSDTSSIEYASFADFVAATHLESYADLSHLSKADDALSVFVRASLVRSTPALPAAHTEAMLTPAQEEVSQRPFKSGPKARPQMVPALLAQEDAESRAAGFMMAAPVEFGVVPRWEIDA
ncbi:SMI1/KNR4 family protein [Pigmentiphaga aceris]|uniref:SMI1/KNR4 family protein n=1 Tax=Pigmentiphaga aceris TaxID=1940612 RepID=A0A5C0AX80_9BURK|nr:SMI1/KNR4 family protein [Pigmentiphaga aceris]QEI04957.1 SMI1/KNR4 family protein [Pigmentiphaga aceris]